MTTIRIIRATAIALLAGGLAVAGCGRSQPDERAAPPPPPPASTAPAPTGGPAASRPIVLPDGRHPVYVSAVDPGRRTISFDLIQFYWGDDAARKAARDHKESPPPNDYYIRNVNPRLRTLPVPDGAAITVNLLGFGDQADHQVSLARLATLTSGDHRPPFWITVHHGQVVKIAEQWVP